MIIPCNYFVKMAIKLSTEAMKIMISIDNMVYGIYDDTPG